MNHLQLKRRNNTPLHSENRNLGRAESMIKKALQLDPDNGAYVDSSVGCILSKASTKKPERTGAGLFPYR
jgi:hypothetical protein